MKHENETKHENAMKQESAMKQENESPMKQEMQNTEHEEKNLQTTSNNSPVNSSDDGFGDYDDGPHSIIRGTHAKFDKNNKWVTKDGEAILPDREFLVIQIIRVTQKWVGGKPETRILGKDEPWPDIKQLNDAAAPHEWQEAFGKKKGPYENAFVAYMLDPKAMQPFTFVTATTGGFRAVRELKERIRIARRLQGPNLYPLVTLTDAFMPTQYGGRQAPHFNIKRFVPIGPDGGGEPQLEHKPGPSGGQPPPQIENQPAAKPTVQTALDTFAATANAKKDDPKQDDPKKAEAKKSLHNELNDKIPL